MATTQERDELWPLQQTSLRQAILPSEYLGRVTATFAVIIADSAPEDVTGFAWSAFSPDGRYLAFRSLRGPGVNDRGRHMFVWDVRTGTSAITALDGRATGWHDACIEGTDNGTRFAPGMSSTGTATGYRIIFTAGKGTNCDLVLRELNGSDVPLRTRSGQEEIIEPAIDASATTIAWAAAGTGEILQVYACSLLQPTPPPTAQPHRCPS